MNEQERRDLVRYWQTFPSRWIEQVLDVKLWAKQEEICQAVADDRRVSVASAHDLGKSFVTACIVLWYLFTHPSAKVITTSVNYKQMRAVLWQEVAVLHRKLKKRIAYAGEIFQTELRIEPGWWALGISSDTPEGFQGYHEEHLLIVIDEAAGIAAEIFDAIETCAAAPSNKILMIGNPTDPHCYFGHTHSGEIQGWTRISMSAYESPNIYIGPDGKYHDKKPLPFPKLVTTQWINDKRQQWGPNDPRFVARVLGRFPDSSEDQLIASRYVSQALAKGLLLRKVYKQLQEGQNVVSSEDLKKLQERRV